MNTKEIRAPMENGTIILKRTFNITIDGTTIRFWRVMSQWHRNANSDLSVEGLKDWGIIS